MRGSEWKKGCKRTKKKIYEVERIRKHNDEEGSEKRSKREMKEK